MRSLLLAALGLFLAASAWADEIQPLSLGQTVYAPVYSEILHGNLDSSGNPSRIPLSAMLSIRNTNPAAAITLTSVSYYDGTGKLLRAFLDKPKSPGAARDDGDVHRAPGHDRRHWRELSDRLRIGGTRESTGHRGGARVFLRQPVHRFHQHRPADRRIGEVAWGEISPASS